MVKKRSIPLSVLNVTAPPVDFPYSVGDNIFWEGRYWRIAYVSKKRNLVLLEE